MGGTTIAAGLATAASPSTRNRFAALACDIYTHAAAGGWPYIQAQALLCCASCSSPDMQSVRWRTDGCKPMSRMADKRTAMTTEIAGGCGRAEKSGMRALREFSRTPRRSGPLSGETQCQSEQFC